MHFVQTVFVRFRSNLASFADWAGIPTNPCIVSFFFFNKATSSSTVLVSIAADCILLDTLVSVLSFIPEESCSDTLLPPPSGVSSTVFGLGSVLATVSVLSALFCLSKFFFHQHLSPFSQHYQCHY